MTCALTASIKKYKLTIKKKREKDNKIMFLAKLNTTEVFIPKALIDSSINHEEFVSANNVVRKYNEMKDEIKDPENGVEYTK